MSKKGVVYTFYSYKGGVGRSMAVANIGVLMALEGYKVLLVDWDLEAPGLSRYFEKSDNCTIQKTEQEVLGVIDILEGYAKLEKVDWRKCCLEVSFKGHNLDLITAGHKAPTYRSRVQNLDWNALFSNHDLGYSLDSLRGEWKKNYDFILIDSRTGITDVGDICTVLLPDILVLMFVSNYQNIEGIKAIISRARKAHSNLPVNRGKLLAVPIPGRDESNTEYDETFQWREVFSHEFGFLYKEWLPKEVEAEDALTKLFIPYVPKWSFGERIPVLENRRELNDPTTIGSAYFRVSTLLVENLDWYSLVGSKENTNALKKTQIELSALNTERQELLSTNKNIVKSYSTKYKALVYLALIFSGIIAALLYYVNIQSEINTNLNQMVVESQNLKNSEIGALIKEVEELNSKIDKSVE